MLYDFVFTQKGIQIHQVFGGWSPYAGESNYVFHSWSLGFPVWERLGKKTL